MWTATGVNMVGSGTFVAALPLLAVSVTHDATQLSFVTAASFIPWLLLSLPAGAIVDRYARSWLMVRTLTVQAVIMAAMTLAIAAGEASLILLVLMALLLGATEVIFANAAQSVLPELVTKEKLAKANGAQSSVTTLGQSFIGPPVGSGLYALAAPLPFVVNAVSFVAAAALLFKVPRVEPKRNPDESIRASISEGLRWLFSHRLLRTLAVLLSINTFCFQLANVALVLLATQTLHLSSGHYGLLLAGAAIGGVVGGLVNARLAVKLGSLWSMVFALAINAVCTCLIGLAPNVWWLGGLMAVNAFAMTLSGVTMVTLRQTIVPPHMLGRVNSVYRMLGWGLMPLGAIAGGAIATHLGVRAGYPIAGALRGLTLLVLLPEIIGEVRRVGIR